ncbi:MAG: hypothetical protein HC804_08250 [Anaerolineae bacterium]|nr:hypothetical protein [Anaerolineae bacterium]
MPDDAKSTVRRLALIFSLVPLILVIAMWLDYDANFRGLPGFAFEYQADWLPLLGSTYHVGLDGISMPMFLLTTLLMPLAILASFIVEERVKFIHDSLPDHGNGDAWPVCLP